MNDDDQISALERLTKLRDSGALSEAEFAAQKATILGTTATTHVRFYRRLWVVVLLTCLLITFPLSLLILVTGDVYKRAKDKSFVPIKRTTRYVYAGLLGLWFAALVIKSLVDPDSVKREWAESGLNEKPNASSSSQSTSPGSVASTTAPSSGQTASAGGTTPVACDSPDAAEMVKGALQSDNITRVLDFGRAQETLFDKQNNARHCKGEVALSLGGEQVITFQLYFGPSGRALVQAEQGDQAMAQLELDETVKKAEEQQALAQPQPSLPTSTQSGAIGGGAVNGNSPPTAKFHDDLAFSSYPVEVYNGPVSYPDFAGRARDYAQYKTRISDAVRGGVNFSGTMAIAGFGCGTGCIVGYATDVRSGDVYDLPVGGEDYPQLSLVYRPNSSLIEGQWTGADLDHPTCVHAFFQWTGGKFNSLQKREIAGECPDAP